MFGFFFRAVDSGVPPRSSTVPVSIQVDLTRVEDNIEEIEILFALFKSSRKCQRKYFDQIYVTIES